MLYAKPCIFGECVCATIYSQNGPILFSVGITGAWEGPPPNAIVGPLIGEKKTGANTEIIMDSLGPYNMLLLVFSGIRFNDQV